MNIRYVFLLFAFCLNTAWADFSNIGLAIHPSDLGNNPFIIEITGEWPTDCHPGEQKPIISAYDKDSVLIEFETVVAHDVCNDVVTPYRVLVDMSDAPEFLDEHGESFDLTIRFEGFERTTGIPIPSIEVPHISVGSYRIAPEPGIYYSEGLDKQGLLLARQNDRMGVYPLIYDENGSSEWVLGPGGIVEDAFFADLFEFTEGQCLGCPPPEAPLQINAVGKISMLMDIEGVIQVKINDGLFKTYKPSVFGYGEFEKVAVDDSVGKIPDLSGRWAFVKNGPPAVLGSTPPPNSFLPLVFDVKVRNDVQPPLPDWPPSPVDNVLYSILDMAGEEVTAMRCFYDKDMGLDIEMYCSLYPVEETDSFSVGLQSIERMVIFNDAPVYEGLAPGVGIYVRID